jgi:hypothetical protein
MARTSRSRRTWAAQNQGKQLLLQKEEGGNCYSGRDQGLDYRLQAVGDLLGRLVVRFFYALMSIPYWVLMLAAYTYTSYLPRNAPVDTSRWEQQDDVLLYWFGCTIITGDLYHRLLTYITNISYQVVS